MLDTILVPLDGSPFAERALPYAATLARATGGRLLLVHVREGAARDANLAALVARLRADGVAAATRVPLAAAGEETADAILAAARDARADLLVMSTHGRGGLGRLVLGSVADRVLRRTDRPVLLVPPACAPAWGTSGQPRVLVGLDGSALAEEVLEPATALAAALGAGMVLLSVVVPPPPGYGYFEEPSSGPFGYDAEPALAEARDYLRGVAARLGGAGPNPRIRVAVGLAAPTIAGVAAEEAAWAVATATHGRGGLARVVLGSVAADLLARATVPLLVVRPVGPREAPPAGARAPRRAGAEPSGDSPGDGSGWRPND